MWKNYKSKTITEAIDSKLRGEFQESEASRVLQIGLLCTQTNRLLRPSMSEVVQMLKADGVVLPSPQQRPFQNSSMLSSDGTTKSCSSSSKRHSTVDNISCESYPHYKYSVHHPYSVLGHGNV